MQGICIDQVCDRQINKKSNQQLKRMQIRIATLSDIELLRDFAERTFRVAYEADNDPEHFNNYCKEAFTTAQLRREMEHPHSAFWLGWLGDHLVAYLKLNFDQQPAFMLGESMVQVERIYIDPDYQGRGLGEKMLQLAEDQARQAHATWIWLSVWQKNPRAIRFYERCGYDICGTEIFEVADDPQLDWVMKKKV